MGYIHHVLSKPKTEKSFSALIQRKSESFDPLIVDISSFAVDELKTTPRKDLASSGAKRATMGSLVMSPAAKMCDSFRQRCSIERHAYVICNFASSGIS
jgi:hypothetical protein